MKLHADNNIVERSGVGAESTFRIKTTAKSFDILSSGLYPDPRLAVVRELSCNAYDAHVAAGNADEPFEIHLPNSLEPYLSIKDFGTGLSEEDILGELVDVVDNEGNVIGQRRENGLYTTYFESTKTDSDDYIGALGLGSKSPFSYTKSFEVYSRQNGIKKTYCVFVNENGVPSVALMGQCETTEHNGLEVRITVQPDDFWQFSRKTASALRWFPVKPKIVGDPFFEWPDMPPSRLEGDGWKMFEQGFAGDYSKMTAVQGNVAYKVDISKLELCDADIKLLEMAHVVGFFNIGELEVAANREEIRYDKRSQQNLIDKISKVRMGVLSSIEQQVDALRDKPFWNVCLELNEIAKNIFNDRRLFQQFVQVSNNDLIQQYLKIDGCLQIGNLKGHELSAYEKSARYSTATIRNKRVGNAITPEPHITVFYNDMDSGGIARVKEWLRQHTSSSASKLPVAVVIRPRKKYEEPILDQKGGTISKKTWTEQDYVKELIQLREELGNVQFLLTSKDAPKPVREQTSKKNTLPIYRFNGTAGKYKKRIKWERDTKVNLTAGGLWFPLESGAYICFYNKAGALQRVSWSVGNTGAYLSQAVRLINQYLDEEYTMDNVYAVGSQAVSKIKKNEKWISLFDVLREAMHSFEDPYLFFRRLERTPDPHGIKDICRPNSTTRYHEFKKAVADLDPSSVFRQACLPLIEDYSKYEKLRETISFVKRTDIDLGTKIYDNDSKVEPFFTDNTFKEVYPMLAFVSSLPYTNVVTLDALFDYIKLIDRS